jgi:hypothetical protein
MIVSALKSPVDEPLRPEGTLAEEVDSLLYATSVGHVRIPPDVDPQNLSIVHRRDFQVVYHIWRV